MTRLGRVYAIALILAKSQLRAARSGRGGESIFRNPAILAVIDGVCFVACAAIGYAIAGIDPGAPPVGGRPPRHCRD